jgi:hypothetical protein
MSVPVVSIGRREFPVPELVIEQMRVVYPAIGRLSRFFAGGNALLAIDQENMSLLLDTVFVGIASGSPGFTRQEFQQLPAKPLELITALGVIADQGGMLDATGEGAPTGEAVAASP